MNGAETLIAELSNLGVDYCASVPGGGIMYLVDAVGKSDAMRVRFFHHEQSAAFAAEAYGRAEARPAVCLVTIGPGVANAVAGAFSAFLNSVPCIFVSGAKRSNIQTDYKRVRFNYPQDADTKAMVSGVVKEFFEVDAQTNLADIARRAVEVANSGRPGPVWISHPLDLQGAPYEHAVLSAIESNQSRETPDNVYVDLLKFLGRVERPVLLLGRGCEPVMRSPAFQSFLENAGLPVITSIGSNHVITAARDKNLGFFGPTGRRAANWALTKADAIIALGSGLDIDNTGFDREAFFRGKAIFSLNSDENFDLSDCCEDFNGFNVDLRRADFERLASEFVAVEDKYAAWLSSCLQLEGRLSVAREVETNLTQEGVDPYLFCQNLISALPEKVAIAGGISLDVHALSHVAKLKAGQEFYLSPHCGQLGWDLPAAVGLADTGRYARVVCVTGDGSAMFNIQELATLSRTDVPFNLFILANDGYNSIRSSQDTHLGGRYFGSDSADLGFPDWAKLSEAFNFRFHSLENNAEATSERLSQILAEPRSLTILRIDPKRGRTPRLVSKIENGKFVSPTLAEQWPFLSEQEVAEIDAIFSPE